MSNAKDRGYWTSARMLASVAIAGALATYFATSRYGPGVTTDSATYLSATASMFSSDGVLDMAGAPYTLFPPLFPAALRALGVFALDAVQAA